MDTSRLASTTHHATVVLTIVLLVAGSIAFADGIFNWDLLPRFWDRIAQLLIWILSFGLAGSAVLSLVIDVGRIAESLAELAKESRRHE